MKLSARMFLVPVCALLLVLSSSSLAFASPAGAVQTPINVQQFIPNRNPVPDIGLYTCSSTSPCPMGVADYGVNGNTNYKYKAVSFTSWANFTSLNISNNGQITIQQNLVDYGVNEGHDTGEYWPQDVPYLTQTATGAFTVQELDNIWNFSSTTAQMGGKIYPNLDSNCSQHGGQPEYYYCLGNQSLKTTLPMEIKMVTVTGKIPAGQPHAGASYVQFGIWVYHSGTLVGGQNFDKVAFSGTATSAPKIQVGGKNPFGLYNDAETVLCGPGGGQSHKIVSISGQIAEAYQAHKTSPLTLVTHAWSAGTDTAETVSGVVMSSTTPGTGIASTGTDNNVQLW
jgi:hypothetical protein